MDHSLDEVIDFRARPNVPEFAAYLEPRLELIARATRGSFGSYRAPVETLEGFVGQLDAAGIGRAVVAARSRARSTDWTLTRDIVSHLVDEAPGRLVALVGLDLTDTAWALEEARAVVADHRFLGVSLDPFQLDAPADDERIFPIYELCEQTGMLVVITLGALPGVPAGLACSSPIAVDRVAQTFPRLLILASHAGWPFVTEMLATAWRNEHVYFENSFYHLAPGAEVLAAAASSMVAEKMLYASAYPFAPLASTLQAFRRLPFDEPARRRVLHHNAARLIEQALARGEEKGQS